MHDLSIIIPARNEMFLSLTVENLLKNLRADTEIIVILDGAWADPGVPDDPRVNVIYHHEAIGQRAATNEAARVSTGRYIMKLDAHCVIDEGMDEKMLAAIQPDWTMVPVMYNLHAFNWVCKNGHTLYQGPTPSGCNQCGLPMHREIIFQRRESRKSTFYRFDRTLHFQYWGAFKERPEAKVEYPPSMSLQGSCFMLSRERYFALDICDERHGSWGQQGTEVACKTWLSGGEVRVNPKTWYSHLFRTQGGDFGFPYPLSGSDTDKARAYSRSLFIDGKWEKAIHPLSWLIDKFKPIPDWHTPTEEIVKPKKGVVYYTHGVGDPQILDLCRRQILRGIKGKHIVSVSLSRLAFGSNIVHQGGPGYLTMAKQILTGLEASSADVVFFCEHDVLYHPSHFDFVPPRQDVIYYNTNVWRVRYPDGHALFCNDTQQLSGLVAYRKTLLDHYRKRVAILTDKLAELGEMKDGVIIEGEAFRKYVRAMGFEPGTHGRPERVDDLSADSYQAAYPNIDIRTDTNLTPSRWNKDQFRNERYTRGWTEVETVPPWNWTPGKFAEYLRSL